jgi:hypothetical protein
MPHGRASRGHAGAQAGRCLVGGPSPAAERPGAGADQLRPQRGQGASRHGRGLAVGRPPTWTWRGRRPALATARAGRLPVQMRLGHWPTPDAAWLGRDRAKGTDADNSAQTCERSSALAPLPCTGSRRWPSADGFSECSGAVCLAPEWARDAASAWPAGLGEP